MSVSTISAMRCVGTVPFMQFEIDIEGLDTDDALTITLLDEYGVAIQWIGEPICFSTQVKVATDGTPLHVAVTGYNGFAGTLTAYISAGSDSAGGAGSGAGGKCRLHVCLPCQGNNRFSAAHVAGIAGVTDIV